MISVSEALERLFALTPRMPVETVPLAEAHGRVMITDAVARRTQPPFPASAMDGYAVRACDAGAGAHLDVIGEAAAGRRYANSVGAGQAVRIFTGAPVPDGADTILIQEDAERSGDRIKVVTAPQLGAYVRPAGGDFTEGERLQAPRRLGPRDIALLAAMNVASVQVARRPKVALIPTGDELVLPGQEPGPDQIVSSNNFGLAAMIAAIGAEPILGPIARDNRDSLIAALNAAEGADIVVSLGGASVGDHDLVAEVFQDQGLTLGFYKVAMRPGKPLMAGTVRGQMMLGLPGNPVSAMVCGEIFLRPVLDAAMGLQAAPRQRLMARLAHAIPAGGPREHYMRANLRADGSIEVFDNQDSSLVATLARANALAIRKPYDAELGEGDPVPFIPL